MKLIVALLTLSFSMMSWAQVYTGEKKMVAKQSIELKGAIREILEGDTDYRVLIGINAAFYSFPKTSEQKEVLEFLQKSKKEGFPVKATVDPIALKILKLEKAEKK